MARKQRNHHRSNASGTLRWSRNPSALLLALVRRARWLWLGWLEQRWAALRQWLLKYKPERAKPASPFRIDTFEPRLLMAADAAVLQPFAIVDVDNRVPDYGALHSTPTALREAPQAVMSAGLQREAPQIVISSGLVTVAVNITGPGSGQLVAQESGYLLQLQGTDATSTVSLTASDGSSRITLSGIQAAGNVGALNLANADLAGNASFAGTLGSLTLGNISQSLIQVAGGGDVSVKAGSLIDTQIVAPQATLSVNATSWSGSTAGASLLKSAGLKNLATTGDLGIDLQLSGAGFTTNVLSTVQVGGAITGGLWSVHGRAGSINANSSSAPWKLNVSSALVQFITKGDAGGRIAAAALQVLQVGGSARGLQVVIGADLGDDAALGGSGANADSFKPGTLARVRISGSLIDSQIDVSVDPVNGQLGDGNDRQLGTPVQRLQELLIGGSIQGSSRIVAPGFPTSVRVNGQTLNPASVSALSSTPADTTAPSLALQLRSDSGASSTDSLSNDPSIRIQASDAGGLAGFQVALDDKAPQAVTPSAQADGSYLLSASQLNTLAGGSLAQGSHTVQIRVSDTAGNSTAQSLSFSLDDIAPGSATIGLAEASDTGPLGDNRTTENTVTLSGLAEAGVVLQLNGKTNLGTVTAAADGRFDFNVVPLDLGANSFTVTQTDAAGNSRSQAYEVTREQPTVPDTTKPTVSAALVQDTGSSSSDGITRNPAVQGTASDDRGVTQLLAVLDPAATPSFTDITSSLNADGSFSLSAAQLASLAGGTLGQGAHTLRLIAKDAAGNESTPFNLSFTLDTAAPTLSNFGLAPASDTGTQGDNRTTDSSVTLAGTAEAAATVSLLRGGSTLGTVTAAADGSFSFSSIALALGSNDFSLTLSDAAGNTSSSTLTVTRDAVVVPDTTKPSVSAALVQDTGSSGSDGLTRNPAVQGTASDDRGVTQLLAVLDPGATPSFTDITANLNADGSFSLSASQLASLAGGTLGQGAHTVRLIAKDAAGNESTPFNLSFTLDTAAPALSSFGLAAASDTGTQGDSSTTEAIVTLTGTAEAGATATLQSGGSTLGVATVAANGSFSFSSVALAVGSNAFSLNVSDAAGNSASSSLTITREASTGVDGTAPVVTAALSNDSGSSSSDRITRNPAVSGQATDAVGVTQLLAVLDPGSNPSFSDISASLQANGSFSLSAAQLASLAGGTLGQGAHTLRLIARDAAGNESTPFNLSFTLDSVAPSGASFGIAAADSLNGNDAQTSSAVVLLRGSAEPGSTISLAGQGLSATASGSGSFQLPGVALATGDNTVTLTVSDTAGNSQTVSRVLSRVTQVQTDAVLQWNDIALRAVQLDVTDPPIATRTLAMVSLAQYDTLAAIEGSPAYLVQRGVSGAVNAQAAVATAAHRILSQIYPAQKSLFDAALASQLAAIAEGSAKDTGIALGLSVADAVLAARSNDGAAGYSEYAGSNTPGQWRPTGPAFDVPDEPYWGTVTPFALTSPSQFRPTAPPALDTAAYAVAVNEVKQLGSATGSTRTADQTQQALFWADGKGSYTPPGHWNQIASQVALAKGNSLSANARLFAQLNVALADAAIACWDAKYSYGGWRPETAIQLADQDSNGATTADVNWRPFLLSPAHPDYVSGHSTFSAAAASVLGAAFGNSTSFSTTSATLPGVSRSFNSFSDAAEEAGRSRVYGGIHFEFSNAAGKALGAQVASAVLQRFALTQDTQAPTVVLAQSAAAVNSNFSFRGQVLDNLSGVASASYSLDGGAVQSLSLDANGGFVITTALATNGSADGTHVLSIRATDAAGNASAALSRSFVLDTRVPTITLGSLAEGDTLRAGSRLSGNADPNGTALTQLSYRIDGGTVRSLSFDAATGSFDEALNFSDLEVGTHTLTLSARDAAGNAGTLTRTLKVEQLLPFNVVALSPADGSTDIGLTQRPIVSFSRAVNPSTLNDSSFFATGPDGAVLPATIVPAADGSFAWLFFAKPMPGGAQITLHVDGSKIRAAADGAFLDADTNGTAGGVRTLSFTTVSSTAVVGTKLVGKVVDPGADLEPMTFDDIRRGADGIIHTADDVFLLPIAHAKVFILGQEDQFVYTDANGNFELSNVPAGAVKVAVDGRTATNAPSGVFFPEMVMAAELKPGVTNTLMDSMGSTEERLANAGRIEVYLPRVATSVLQAVSATEPTVITVEDPKAAPALSEQQRDALTLTINPGSAVDEQGNAVADLKIGIATVPPELVRDMLPPGVLQHTFDITIQAPGVATFTEPVQITFPNVFNAAPGTKLNILSFDHTTGMLVINGTGTVSADGLTVVSDPDSGVKAPGWHGLTPPGGPSDPPCPPGTPHTIEVNPVPVTAGLQDRFFKDDDGDFTLSFGNAAPKLDPSGDPCNPTNIKATPLVVDIKLDGPAAKFLNGLTDQTFSLQPQQQKNIQVSVKDLLANIKDFHRDWLYGTTVTIKGWKSSDPGSLLLDQKIYLYRFVDSLDANLNDGAGAFHKDGIVMMADTLNDGAGNVQRKREFVVETGSEVPTLTVADTTHFKDIGTGTEFIFDPTATSANKAPLKTSIAVKTPKGSTAGTLNIQGEATPVNLIDLNEAGLKAAIATMLVDGAALGGNVEPFLFTKSEAGLFSTQAEIDSFAADVIAGMKNRFDSVPSLAGGYAFGSGANAIKFNWATSTVSAFATSQPTPADDGVDINQTDIFNAVANASFANYNLAQQAFIASDLINQSFKTGVDVYIDNILEYQGNGDGANANVDPMSMTRQQAVNTFVKTAVHESVHTLGMLHAAQTYTGVETAEVQVLALAGGAAADTFKLSFQGYDTANLPRNATPAQIQTALTGLLSIGAGNVVVTASPTPDVFRITFSGVLLGYNPPMITASSTGTLGVAVGPLVQGNANAALFATTPGGEADIMHGGWLDYDATKLLRPNVSANHLLVGMHLNWTSANTQKLITFWGNQLTAGGAANGVPLQFFDSIFGPDVDFPAPVFTGPVLIPAVLNEGGITSDVDFGDVKLDAASPQATKVFRLYNVGTEAVLLSSAQVTGGQSQFSVAALGGTVSIAPGSSYDLSVTFKPGTTGTSQARLELKSNATNPALSLPLVGQASWQAAHLSLEAANNNAGGQAATAGAKTVRNFVTLRNDGDQPLSITGIGIEGDAAFSLINLPAGLSPAQPLVLAKGESRTLDLGFDPSRVGLVRAAILVQSNDPAHPQSRLSVVGTGTGPVTSTLDHGNDYVVLETPNVPNSQPLRTVSDANGGWSFVLPPDQALRYSVFDPVSGLISTSYDTSAASGQRTALIGSDYRASTAPDSDGDGLPDDIEFAIGTAQGRRDTDRDGLDDFTEIEQGLDPLGGLGIPTGVVSAVSLRGDARAVTVVGSADGTNAQRALVATGGYGLAVVDATRFTQPAVLAQLDLPGVNVDVAADTLRDLAAVAGQEAGLHIVSIANPSAPSLVQTVALGASVNAVALRDGIAYAAYGADLAAIDLNTGDLRSNLRLGNLGGGVLSDVAVDGSTLYTLDVGGTLRSYAINGDELSALDILSIPGSGGSLFVAAGVAYLGTTTEFAAGYQTVNVANPADLRLLSGPDAVNLVGQALAPNGSGLLVNVGSLRGPRGEPIYALDIVGAADPANTGAFISRINLPSAPHDVALANGLAFVADGSGGLQIVNYIGFDTLGVPPSLSISVQGVDADAATPGVQVLEGRTLRVLPTITDDVQVRNVELLVNGQVVSNDVSYPFELFTQVPTIASGGSSVTLQVRATDTGGNVSLSNTVSFTVVPDTFAPKLNSMSLAEGARLFFVRSVDLVFDEPLDLGRLSAGGVTLVRDGGDGVFGNAGDQSVPVRLDTRNRGQALSVLIDTVLPAGNYRLRIDPSILSDRSGNAFAAAVERNFSIRPASDVRAGSGVPDIPTAPSANPGQQIGIAVPFAPSNARADFKVIDANGTVSTRTLNVFRVDTERGLAFFNVPIDAVSGDMVVYQFVANVRTDFADLSFSLQVLPTISDVQIESLAGDGSSATLLIAGTGFVEGGGSEYRVGTETIVDGTSNAGPDVLGRNDAVLGFVANGYVRLTVPLSAGVFGPISIKTGGGVSAAYSANLGGINSVALSGTPSDPGQASANAGQTVTLSGSGLSTASDILMRWVDVNGNAQMVQLSPSTAAADGSSATLIVPAYANGAFTLQMFGSSSQPLLQIVPTLSGVDIQDRTVVFGSGFVEGAAVYSFAGVNVADTAGEPNNIDEYYSVDFGYQNGSAYLNRTALPSYGQGNVVVQTAGGTSAAYLLNSLRTNVPGQALGDVAVDAAGKLWVGDQSNPGQLLKIEPGTGQVLQTITVDNNYGTPYLFNYLGLQVTRSAMKLAGVDVPVGSLLVFNGQPNTDRVLAVNPANGAIVASLSLANNHDLVAGTYDPITGHLFVAAHNSAGGTALVEVNPANGVQVAVINAPFNIQSWAGLAIQPGTGHLWLGAANGGAQLVEYRIDGPGVLTELRRVDTRSQGINENEISGLNFAADGSLWVSSTRGDIYKIDVNAPGADVASATLSQIVASATNGVAANAAQAAANVDQTIELIGTNFSRSTLVLFDTIDTAGNRSTIAQAPLVINAAGTRLQVQVPGLATTGNVRVVNQGSTNLGFGGNNDAIYRNVSLNFVASASTATVRFSDGGLEGIGNESWGIDNVSVKAGGTTVFEDNFESAAAKPQWSDPLVNADGIATFSRFSGRFSNNASQALNLSGLSAGQSYTLNFDLLVLDSWDGSNTGAGPDLIDVSIDGTSVLRDTFSNMGQAQSFRASAPLRLQIVPTLNSIDGGRPGEDTSFNLRGSGFAEGASTVTIGGIALVDNATNNSPFDVSGVRNDTLTVVAPRSLDGPIRISTEGGFAQLNTANFGAQPVSVFTGISASAALGSAADPNAPSANTGQTIVLQGQGFTSSTLVQFQGVDDNGTLGTLTRSGSVGAGGTTLSVVVPALARSGAVSVLGSAAAYNLQIVPTLKSVGGAVASGNTIVLEGSGLSRNDLAISIDGRGVGSFSLRTLIDGTSTTPDQQLITLTVPAGIGAGLITLSTAGGQAQLRTALALGDQGTQAGGDADTLASAGAAGVLGDSRIVLSGAIGAPAAATSNDVDLYRVDMAGSDILRIGVQSTDLNSRIRVFDAAGNQLATTTYGLNATNVLEFNAPAGGSYYVGISGSGNSSYNPASANSGTAADAGSYQLRLELQRAGSARISSINASAASGTAAVAGVAGANTGQAIVINGVGLLSTDRVVFTTLDTNGNLSEAIVTPTSVDTVAQTLSVSVPTNAITGRVRLERDRAGVLLQIVPTISDLSMTSVAGFIGNNLQLSGSGFAEGATTVLMGDKPIADPARNQGLDVFGTNSGINLTVPNAAPSGPLSVRTAGGTSAAFVIGYSGLVGSASSGIAANPAQPSANPGQLVTVQGSALDNTTDVVFQVIDANGSLSDQVVRPTAVNAAGSEAQVRVPNNAVSAAVRVVGSPASFNLQVLPVIGDVQVESVAGDGSSATLLIAGTGFIEGGNTEYRFGSRIVIDAGTNSAADVLGRNDAVLGFVANGYVRLTVPLSAGVFGPISIKTGGGVSAAYSANLGGINSVALSGTPSDPGQASANAGQTVTLSGSGLSTASDILMRWVDVNGNAQMVQLSPSTAAADGSSATLIVPAYANGAFTLQMFGSSSQPLLQIVPTLSGVDIQDRTVVFGSGFVEGAAVYSFAGVNVADTAGEPNNIDEYYSVDFGYQNGSAYLNRTALPSYGQGNVVVQTAGGTSAAYLLNSLRTNVPGQALGDVAVDAAGKLWVGDQSNPGQLLKIEPGTGQVLQTITVDNNYGTPYLFNYLGLQVTRSAMKLAGVDVPVGSLLVFNGQPNTDRVLAVNPANGAIVASLSLANNHDLVAGTYDPITGHLFVAAHNSAGGTALVEVNPANGVQVAVINAPFNIQSWAGLAIQPGTGHLWLGAANGGAQLVEYRIDGPGVLTELRRVDTRSQGINENEISGLNFAADGSLWVSSTRGDIYKIDVNAPGADVASATLSQIVASATNGVAANAAQAAANVDQTIELIGTNFSRSTLVLFDTIDTAGNRSTIAQAPLVINAAGTRLQVQVPGLATTGNVRVVNQGSTNLGFGGNNDAIYRNVSLNFVASASTATVRFSDGGLEGIGNESWGIDNVSVKAGGTTVFEDNFESAAAKPQWSDPLVNADGIATFSRFSGRFSNNASQALNLSGLSAGQSYTLNFDLLVLDSWDGSNTGAGPDLIDVSIDGTSVLRDTFSNMGQAQSFRASAPLRLQIVPTLNSIDGGRPGEDTSFNLRGSGFAEGASTVTIGGIALVDNATNNSPFDVSGVRNDTLTVVAPRSLDGPIRISTEGGFAQLNTANFGAQPVSVFTGISASAALGSAADPNAPSANTGQTIVLQGQGFTSSTLVQFQGVDDNGTLGTLTRSGSVGAGGTTLSVVVPALARSGAVSVLGSAAAYNLQIVPTLKSVGGAVASGNTIVLEGSGLSRNDLAISIDGRGVGSFSLRTLIDGTSTTPDQQLITLTVPAGIGAGLITLSTAGGQAQLRTALALGDQGTQAGGDADTLASAGAAGVLGDSRIVLSGAIGAPAAATSNDVDLYRVDMAGSDILRIGVQSTDLNSRIRVFDAAGNQLATTTYGLNATNVLEFNAPAGGSYYVGISGSGNSSYNPANANSGTAADAGSYQLRLELQRAGSARISSINASAASGTAAVAGVAGANTGQAIVINGVGLLSTDRVVFTTLDTNGNLSEAIVTPTSVDTVAQTLSVSVPTNAITGRVRLERDRAGVLLQIVPTISDLSMTSVAGFIGNNLQLSGSGFAEGATTVLMGDKPIADPARNQGLDVFGTNSGINLTVPNAAPSGPLSVRTAGGTSAAFVIGYSGLVGSASSGIAANPAQPSANPGQLVTVQGSALDNTTDVVFQVIDANGSLSDQVVRPTAVNAAGSEAQVRVPNNAVSAAVRVVGSPASFNLQVLPVIGDVQVESVAGDGSSATLLIAGTGFIEGGNTEYRFGSRIVIDAGTNSAADVLGRNDAVLGFVANGYVRLTVPLSAGVFGPISIKTGGGVSAAYSANLGGINSVALSGTPSDPGQASANAGQTVTLSGSGLSTASDILMRWVDVNGNAQMVQLSPSTAAADGSSATLIVPAYANGAFTLQMFGSSSQPLLQIVPTLSGVDIQDRTVVFGSGFVEGAAVYSFAGVNVADTAGEPNNIDEYYSVDFGYQNGSAYLNRTALPSYGQGNVVVQTAGGTSAAYLLNSLRTNVPGQALGDVAVDAAGKLWVGDQSNPGQLLKIEPGTGQVLQTISVDNNYGTPYLFNYLGLQVTRSAMKLAGVDVPVGSLLVFNGQPNTDRVLAVNPANGAIVASLSLANNHDLVAGTYDPITGHLFVAAHNSAGGTALVEVNPANGVQVAVINAPFNIQSWAGLAIQPGTGHLWLGAANGGAQLVEYRIDGPGVLTELRRVDTRSQGINENEISGLNFAADGSLWVSSTRGDIYRLVV